MTRLLLAAGAVFAMAAFVSLAGFSLVVNDPTPRKSPHEWSLDRRPEKITPEMDRYRRMQAASDYVGEQSVRCALFALALTPFAFAFSATRWLVATWKRRGAVGIVTDTPPQPTTLEHPPRRLSASDLSIQPEP